ncbi:condensation domain-containing protein, partial [Streptomyces sp. NPDC015350]|uniref:condensation domain-containing protein n=1 Tax=Streptomyces sp. NPDC015350 TaxID=3364955 RepID=UPI0036F98369
MTNVENIYKLTPLQSGMLFHVLYDASDANPYVAQSIDEFTGPLDVTRLREAWQAVVDRHTALRSAFVWEGLDEPLQVVQRRVELPFEVIDWRSLPADEQERRLDDVLGEDRGRGFDLGSAPLLRLTVVRLADERATVLWTFHHLLLDGWSTQMVQKEVFTLYRTATDGTAARLPDPVPYARYIGWLGEQSRDRAEQFWRRYLGGFAEPTALGIGGATGANGFGDVDLELGADLAGRIGDFARAHRVTVNTVVQGAWALLLSRYGGGDEVVYGSTVSGRPAGLEDAESIVGLFINTLPVRARVRSDLPVAEWLRELQGEHVELRQFEYTSLVDAQGWSAVPKGEQLFRSILVFENYPKILGDSDLPGNLAVHHQKGIARTGYPLTAAVGHTDEQLLAEFTYDKSLFRHEEIERLTGHFAALLSSLVADPAALVGELEMLGAAELRALSEERGGVGAGVADAATLHGLVAERARECPDAVALIVGGESLSYGELDARSNRLARHLAVRGVSAGSLVGVCLERGPDLVVGLLGVLKAGG